MLAGDPRSVGTVVGSGGGDDLIGFVAAVDLAAYDAGAHAFDDLWFAKSAAGALVTTYGTYSWVAAFLSRAALALNSSIYCPREQVPCVELTVVTSGLVACRGRLGQTVLAVDAASGCAPTAGVLLSSGPAPGFVLYAPRTTTDTYLLDVAGGGVVQALKRNQALMASRSPADNCPAPVPVQTSPLTPALKRAETMANEGSTQP